MLHIIIKLFTYGLCDSSRNIFLTLPTADRPILFIINWLLTSKLSRLYDVFSHNFTSCRHYKCMWFLFSFIILFIITVSHFKSCLELTIGFMGVYQITQRTIAFWKAWSGIQWGAFVQPRLYGASFCSIYLINREIFCISIAAYASIWFKFDKSVK